MRPLVMVRRATAFDPRFVERSRLFGPVSGARGRLGLLEDFPRIDDLARVFADDPPVRFVAAGPRRHAGGLVDVRSLYDARISLDREVPTRARCWHDLMNALVWGTFPAAKMALHARQHAAIAARIAPRARTLPPRTAELDALALVDEGGVVVAARPDETAVLVFGHAIYESLALGVSPAVVAALVLDVPLPEGDDDLRPVDLALAAALADPSRFRSPKELRRLDLGPLSRGHADCAV